MRKFGLIGYPLSHSFSPGYFKEKFETEGIENAHYGLYPLDSIEDFEGLDLEHMSGINVTIPYKEQVIPYLDELSPEACAIGAVNVIKIHNGKYIGYNSDTYGFCQALLPMFEGREQPEAALVLGTGGAAKAVWYVLEDLGIRYAKVSRTKGDLTYDDLDEEIIGAHHLIVNTTPLGMSPNIESCPDIPYEYLGSEHVLFDLVYNPSKTLFLKKGESAGAAIKNGHRMLELQAKRSWEIWNTND